MSIAVPTIPDFKPAWWLPNRHLQTLWPLLRRFKNKFPLRRERVELADGDFLDLDWSLRPNGPIVLLLHGLEGSSNSPYAQGFLKEFEARGWRTVVMHFRGCSGEMNRLPRAYHSGDTADLASVVKLISTREPNTPLVAVGVSMGGNVLLKWLGETGVQNPLQSAAAISVPFDLGKSIDYLQRGFSRVYDQHLLLSLKRKFELKIAAIPSLVTLAELKQFKTIREFDDKVTAPLYGFADAIDYYQQASCLPYLAAIKVPTLIVNALDDPFVPLDVVPTPADVSVEVKLALTEQGGHVGFIGGNPWRPTYWLENKVGEFFGGTLRETVLSSM
jgi:predicted alpha/beta-fold hydrolase